LIVKCEIRIKIKYNKNDNAYDGNIKKDARPVTTGKKEKEVQQEPPQGCCG